MAFSLINWWAVLVAAMINVVAGFPWLRLMNIRTKKIQEAGGALTYLIPVAGAFVSATVLAMVLGLLRVFTVWGGAGWGAMLWFAFGGTGLLTASVFEGRTARLSWRVIVYMVLVHAAQGAMFAVWR